MRFKAEHDLVVGGVAVKSGDTFTAEYEQVRDQLAAGRVRVAKDQPGDQSKSRPKRHTSRAMRSER